VKVGDEIWPFSGRICRQPLVSSQFEVAEAIFEVVETLAGRRRGVRGR
jgi:hypothetical protein